MTFKSASLIGAALLLSAPSFASTYFGGFEDTVRNGDGDYNDIVFSLTGSGLALHTTDGAWFNAPTLAANANPFWNRSSFDGANYNVGYCIYGGGACNGGVALDPGAQYLAKAGAPTQTANNVYFTTDGRVSAGIRLEITADTDVLGWYSLSNPGSIHWLNGFGQTGVFSFNPEGTFGIAANNGVFASGNTYSSSGNSQSSQFAFFGNNVTATPEPGALSLVATGFIGVGLLLRRKRQTKA